MFDCRKPPVSFQIFGASGNNHSVGLVPDPGSTAGLYRFLREDGTWFGSERAPLVMAVANGLSAVGGVTVANAVAGDLVLLVLQSSFVNASSSFEGTVSVSGQVQQTSSVNLSGNVYLFNLIPES